MLIRSGEAFDDLLLKCDEGQTFYKDVGERVRTLRTELEQIDTSIQRLEPTKVGGQTLPAAPSK